MAMRLSHSKAGITEGNAGPFVPSPSVTLTQLTLNAPSIATRPWAVGHVFKKGDLPAGQVLSGIQTNVKSTWPDGSARIAVLSGITTMLSTSHNVVVGAGTQPSGLALSTTSLKATGITASIDAGAFGSASWSNTDWDTPFQTWVSGPVMSSWVYRKPIGSDAHLVAWLEVRLWATGATEVIPWIENGYIRVAAPTNKNATYSFTLGGTQRFNAVINLQHHTRTVLISGTALSHWLGTDPGVTCRHDTTYMQATKVVPSYQAVVAANSTRVNALPTSYTPLQQGNFFSPMGGTGYQPSIGLLPEWDVLYLTAESAASSTVYNGVVRNGYSAGRWPTHYRDENTNRPPRFSQFPNISLNASTVNDVPPSPTGGTLDGWDIPHHPSMGFMAYLVTGRWYFMEEVLFTATMNYLRQVDGGPNGNRRGSEGVFMSRAGANTVRGMGWAIRTLAQAVAAVPDADTALRTELINSMQYNIDYNHSMYVAQPNNPFGFVETYGDAYGTTTDGTVTEGPWQQDFVTAAFGYAKSLDLPISTTAKTELTEFFAWKAKSAIGRLGGTSVTDWLYRDAAQYNMIVAFVDEPDWATGTGPWPASWGAMYQATLGVANPGTTGDLRGGNFPDATSYWANLVPAISYAVDHNVDGASAAYNRMTEASNWATLTVGWNVNPVWSVQPTITPTITPAYLTSAAVHEWVAVPNSTPSTSSGLVPAVTTPGMGGQSNITDAWCGAFVHSGRRFSVHGGGHGDYGGNEIGDIDLGADAPVWDLLIERTPYASLIGGSNYYADGRPTSRHTYYGMFVDPAANRMMRFNGNMGFAYNGGTPGGNTTADVRTLAVDAFDLNTNSWVIGSYGSMPSETGSETSICQDQSTGDVYVWEPSIAQIHKYTLATKTAAVAANVSGVAGQGAALVFDPVNQRLVRVGGRSGTKVEYWQVGSSTRTTVTCIGPAAAIFNGLTGDNHGWGICRDPVANTAYIITSAGVLYRMRLDDFYVEAIVGGVTPAAAVNGVWGRLQYLSALRAIAYVARWSQPVLVMKVA